MSGVTRVGRLPGHRNCKPRNRGWICALRALDPERRFTIEALVDGFGLQLLGRREPRARLITEEALERNAQFGVVYRWLRERRMLKRDHPDMSGWTEMRCPWRDEHTGGVDSGAAIREPAVENEYHGAFRCHHGHCVDRGWAELTEWMAEESAADLEDAARAAAPNLENANA
jgi:hypothetical protein